LIEALGLPDAAADWRMPEVLVGWALLEAVARALLGPLDEPLAQDPIWPLLARLDGRNAEACVGAGMGSPERPGLPGAWRTAAPALTGHFPGGTLPEPSVHPTWRPSAPLCRWTALFAPWLQARLAQLLESPPDAVGSELQLTARVRVSPSHVDVVAGLDAASIRVRRAGFDIDPGWVPTLGRVLLFHYL
jgi:hypothetical protein